MLGVTKNKLAAGQTYKKTQWIKNEVMRRIIAHVMLIILFFHSESITGYPKSFRDPVNLISALSIAFS